MEERKPTFSILGCCVDRDIFSIAKMEDRCTIEQYVSFASPLSLMREPPKKEFCLLEDSLKDYKGSGFSYRCLRLDCNKQAFSYLAKKQSDYLILDLADARAKIAEFPESGATLTILNFFLWNEKKLQALLGTSYQKKIYTDFSEKEWDVAIYAFLNEVKKIYVPDKIILNQLFESSQAFDKNRGG